MLETIPEPPLEPILEMPPPLDERGGSSAPAYWPLALIVPATAGGLVATAMTLRGAKRGFAMAGVAALSGLALLRWQLARWFTDSPPYRLEQRIGPLEVRTYPDLVLAETIAFEPLWEDALRAGYRRLASYIGRGDVPMTAPVLGTVEGGRPGRTIAFVMPRSCSLSSLPAPRDTRIALRHAPPTRVAVLRFSGSYEGALPEDKAVQLLSLVREAGLQVRGPVMFAGYDPPSTLPALKRNEVWVEIE